jgi:hypothetical protein
MQSTADSQDLWQGWCFHPCPGIKHTHHYTVRFICLGKELRRGVVEIVGNLYPCSVRLGVVKVLAWITALQALPLAQAALYVTA